VISRHFLDVGGRRVHYRLAGSGPALLMAHQSPRSSAEYMTLMTAWSRHFTCIAPDTPGFGLSDPLPIADPDIDDFGYATIAFLDALGLAQVGGYGFHSGGIILMNALRRHPSRFTALGCGGYAVWTADEMAVFGDRYLPPFVPSDYGEHLTWLWNRVLEQSWFFPWFSCHDGARLPGAHDDPERVDAVVREMLDAGDAYRAGYGAVLRAPRGLPPADAAMPPVLIAAYDGDPLQAHIGRLGQMPAGWHARSVATPAAFEAAMLDHLKAYPAPAPPPLPAAADAGFAHITTAAFDGRIAWRRGTDDAVLQVHAPGSSMASTPGSVTAMDLPGHGLSDPWPGVPPLTRGAWTAVAEAVATALGCTRIAYAPLPKGRAEACFPDLSPDRFGTHLTRAWSIARAQVFFEPWYQADAAHAVPVDAAALTPVRLAVATQTLLQATAARAAMQALYGEGAQDGTA